MAQGVGGSSASLGTGAVPPRRATPRPTASGGTPSLSLSISGCEGRGPLGKPAGLRSLPSACFPRTRGRPNARNLREFGTLCLSSLPGWIFGERLHDQERGWFPSNMTEEILNPKIRSQNLKECFRVHKMDDPQRSQNKDRRKLGSRNRQ